MNRRPVHGPMMAALLAAAALGSPVGMAGSPVFYTGKEDHRGPKWRRTGSRSQVGKKKLPKGWRPNVKKWTLRPNGGGG